MCGIAGYVDYRKETPQDVLTAMTDSIVHRGPDDSGADRFRFGDTEVALGFRRLAIIDLTPAGHQPMHTTDGKLSIIFNGEIYNYRELRSELITLGHHFITQSDTEVILMSYRQWGMDCISRFIGMFAIALLDHELQKLFLIRDRAGVKPLYYYQQEGILLFGSELKSFHHHPAFKKEIDFEALGGYLQRGYIIAPKSIYKHTSKVQTGHYLEIPLAGGKPTEHKYWDVIDAYNKPKSTLSLADATEQVESLMLSAFQYRMIADVPVGVFLSGGYDSTIVTALLQANSSQKIKTFTIGFEDPQYDESAHAAAVAKHLGTDHHSYTCTYREALDIIPQLPDIYDEPLGDMSSIPTTLVSRVARQQVTVALSADAGDELFAGYTKYFNALDRIERLSRVPTLAKPFIDLLTDRRPIYQQDKWSKLSAFLSTTDPVARFNTISQSATLSEINRLFLQPVSHQYTYFDEGARFDPANDSLARFMATEYKTYMADDILAKVDRATMSVSLEGREPLLDHRLTELVATLPSSYKYRDGVSKYMLKQIVHKYVPPAIMDRPKMGFGPNLSLWLKHELRDRFQYYFSEAFVREQGIFEPAQMTAIAEAYLAGRDVRFDLIGYLFVFQMWWERWMKE